MEFKKYTQDVEINGVAVEVEISIRVEEDDITPEGDFDFGNAEENAAYLKRFNGGDLFMGVISVNAKAYGETGNDCLGGCHLKCNNMFDSKPFTQDVEDLVKEHGMVNNAIDELKKSIVAKATCLKVFAK